MGAFERHSYWQGQAQLGSGLKVRSRFKKTCDLYIQRHWKLTMSRHQQWHLTGQSELSQTWNLQFWLGQHSLFMQFLISRPLKNISGWSSFMVPSLATYFGQTSSTKSLNYHYKRNILATNVLFGLIFACLVIHLNVGSAEESFLKRNPLLCCHQYGGNLTNFSLSLSSEPCEMWVLWKINCRSLIKVKFYTDQVRPALGSVGCLVGCHYALWRGVRSCVQCGCTVLAKLWRLVGCTKMVSR